MPKDKHTQTDTHICGHAPVIKECPSVAYEVYVHRRLYSPLLYLVHTHMNEGLHTHTVNAIHVHTHTHLSAKEASVIKVCLSAWR